jgi:hypothetical protein
MSEYSFFIRLNNIPLYIMINLDCQLDWIKKYVATGCQWLTAVI